MLRLKAKQIVSASTITSSTADLEEQETEVKDHHYDNFFNVLEDRPFCESSGASSITTCENITQSLSSFSGLDEDCVRVLDMGDNNNCTNVDGKSRVEGKEEEIEEKEDFDMALIDLQFVDEVGSNCYRSLFEIAEKMAKPMEQENHGDEPSMLGETMKRLMFERKFSASLYAFNGIPECLMLKQSGLVANGTERSEQLSHSHHSNLRNNGNKKKIKKKLKKIFIWRCKNRLGVDKSRWK